MKGKMKKTCLLMALAMVLIAACALAETAATPIYECGDFTYVILDDHTVQIVDWEGTVTDLQVPGELDGLRVTGISEYAFYGCDSLTSIILPEGLKEIGDNAFCGCEGLTEIHLPLSITSIGANPFAGCANMTFISVSQNHPYLEIVDGVLFSKPDKRLICFPAGNSAESYTVPEGVVRIGEMAFQKDLYLESVVLPESLCYIGKDAFMGCEALQSMTVPAGVSEIGEGALDRCSRLVLQTAPDTFGARYAFQNGLADAG